MSSAIVLNGMPNVHVDKITVTENNDATTILANITLMDNLQLPDRRWANSKSLEKIKINVSLVEGKPDIQKIKTKTVMLQDKDTKSIKASNFSSRDQDGTFIRYSYSIKIMLSRKISNDSSLFFFTGLNKQKAMAGRRNKVRSMQNHGIYAKSKRTKHKRSKNRLGGIKHLPLFIDGKRVQKLPIYRSKMSGMMWHGEVKYNMATKKFMTNLNNKKPGELLREMVDNDVVLYNMPIRAVKDNSVKLFPLKTAKHKNRPLLKKLNTTRNRPFKYEMDEQVDENGALHKFFMINLCNLALSKSKFAQKIYSADKDLFMQIGESLNIGRVKIERSKFKSLSMVKKNKKSKYRRNRRKFDTKRNHNRRIVAQINLRKPVSLGGLFDLDDKLFKRKKSNPASKLEVVDAGFQNDIKTLYFVDKKAKIAGKGRLSYKVDIDFDDKYYIYVKTALRDMILFKKELLGMKNSIVKTRAYNRGTGKIKDSFIEKYLSKYNIFINNGSIANSASLENSPIVRGISAMENASLLLGMDPKEIQVDSKINFSKASPQTIRSTISDLDKIIFLLQKRYNIMPTFNKVSGRGKGTMSRKADKRKIIKKTFNLKIDNNIAKDHVLYQVMNFDKGLKIDKTALESRANMEMAKYFKGSPRDNDVLEASFDAETKSKLVNINENKYRYFTNSMIHAGKNKSDTSKFNKKVNSRFFNVVKSIRKKVLSNKSVRNIRFNVKDNIPLNIIPESLMSEDNEKENVIQASTILGPNSPFINTSLIKKNFNRLRMKKTEDKMAGNFLFDNKNIKTIAAYDLENENSALFQQIEDKKIDPIDIPLQIKSLIFNKSTSVRSNFLQNRDDIFNNSSTDEIAYQMYGNIFELKYIEDFEVSKDGLVNMQKPIIKSMSGNNYSSLNGSNKICFLHRFTDKMVMQKKDPFRVFGDTFLLVDRGEATMRPVGKTSNNAKHHHGYKVDKDGNGYTTVAVHPDNPNIRHRHRIINWVVQEAKSSCYPRCKDKFNVEGAPPHGHHILKRRSMAKIRNKKTIARRFANTYNGNQTVAPVSTPPASPAGAPTPQSSPQPTTVTMPGGSNSVY